ncbi:hypothetical protein Aduo_018309 [Ancylostoma duodenale]
MSANEEGPQPDDAEIEEEPDEQEVVPKREEDRSVAQCFLSRRIQLLGVHFPLLVAHACDSQDFLVRVELGFLGQNVIDCLMDQEMVSLVSLLFMSLLSVPSFPFFPICYCNAFQSFKAIGDFVNQTLK